MTEQTIIGKSPRTLSASLRRRLWFGTALLMLGQCIASLVILAVLLLLMIYGIPMSELLAYRGESLRVESQLSRLETENLPSGERVSVVLAPVKINEDTLEVRGYGPNTQTAELGDPVSIIIPKSQPRFSYLLGFQKHPLNLKALLQMAALFFAPSLLCSLISAWRSARHLQILERGEQVDGTLTRSIGLPRPMKDYRLARWQFETLAGKEKRFWTLQHNSVKNPTLLREGQSAALLENLLPNHSLENGELSSKSRLSQFFLVGSVTLALSQVLLILAYCLT